MDERDILGSQLPDLGDPIMDASEVELDKLTDALAILRDSVAIDEEVLAARSQMAAFNEYVFQEVNAPHHTEICNALDTFENVTAITPRNSGKSSLASTRYPAFRLGWDRGLRIIICSHTATMAGAFSRSIDSIMRLPAYRLLFGDLVPTLSTARYSDTNKWNETEKIVKDRPEFNKLGYRIDAKDASIFAIGVGGAVVGRRADIIILDDIIDRRDTKTDMQMEDIKYWLNEELKGTRHAKTQVVTVGSRWSARDIYIDIMSSEEKVGAVISGNMVQEVLDQIMLFRTIEKELVT